MSIRIRTVATWLSQKPHKYSGFIAIFILLLVTLISFIYSFDILHSAPLLRATPELVLTQHEYWRAWTSLFIHADPGHFLGNIILLIPLTYLLTGYFGLTLIPAMALLFGGLTNLIVLNTLPKFTDLMGISGVVYWMAGVWMVLYLRIETRFPWRRRIANILFIGVLLLMPEKYSPQISYLSHGLGFLFGLLFGSLLYKMRKAEFLKAEDYEIENEILFVPYTKGTA